MAKFFLFFFGFIALVLAGFLYFIGLIRRMLGFPKKSFTQFHFGSTAQHSPFSTGHQTKPEREQLYKNSSVEVLVGEAAAQQVNSQSSQTSPHIAGTIKDATYTAE